MSSPILPPDDPRLTAYALGELDPAECAEIEALLPASPAARAAVDDIRAAAQTLTAALEREPVAAPAAVVPPEAPRARVFRFPQLYFIVSSAAAACFALFFVYWSQTHEPAPRSLLTEVTLGGSAPVQPAPAAEASADAAAMSAAPAADVAQARGIAANSAAGAVRAKAQAAATMEKQRVEHAAAGRLAAGPVPAAAAPSAPPVRFADAPAGQETYARLPDQPFLRAADNPLSTFSIDVDTAAYANVRRFLNAGRRPPRDAVRIEELVNYFPYAYTPPPAGAETPFAAHLEVASAPWAPEHRLVRIGLKGREVSEAARPAANLVFLLDVSGSMNAPDKLPLVKQAMRLLVDRLRPDDRVAIVVYAGASGLALASTPIRDKARILAAVDALEPAGSTNGEAGIQLAYAVARENFRAGGVNRVILATDGDFNVGVASEGELTRLIEERARDGVFLSVLGFGSGNYQDATLEALAGRGNGNYAYIDTLREARKALVEQAGGTLVTIARDVKIQVEFNPAEVQAYRLIGYEDRMLRKEDFADDKVDAGEIGAGHTVTALYEIVPPGVPLPEDTGGVEPLKYQRPAVPRAAALAGELLTVRVRYKDPAGGASRRLDFPLRDAGREFEDASPDFKFAASVAAFGLMLREAPFRGAATLSGIESWARAGLVDDAGGHRAEFLTLVAKARQLGAGE